MDRVIKFRAWDPVKKRMHYGNEGFDFEGDGCVYENWIQAKHDSGEKPIIMQFTGLGDMDKKEIWEGDILESGEYYRGLVIWKRELGAFVLTSIKGFRVKQEWLLAYWANDKYGGKVARRIGNMYENPELLLRLEQQIENPRGVGIDRLGFDEYQTKAIKFLNPSVKGKNLILNAALGCCSEAGEIAEAIKQHFFQGHPLDIKHLMKEAGDLLWYTSALVTAYKESLENVAQMNLDKLNTRYPGGEFTVERSVNRLEKKEETT